MDSHVANVDSTIILERPKLKDYRQQIRDSLAHAIGLTIDRSVSEIQDGREGGAGGRGSLL